MIRDTFFDANSNISLFWGKIMKKKLNTKAISSRNIYMLNTNAKNLLIDLITLSIAVFLICFSISTILVPNGLVTGGLAGSSILISKLTGINYTYVNYFLSLLILLSSWIFTGRKETFKIIALSIIVPTTLLIMEKTHYVFIKNDMMLASIYFGIVLGLGCGLILKRGYSMGGSDTIAKILHKKVFTFIGISEILLVIDGIVIISSMFILNKNVALYAILSQIIFVLVIDMVMYGFGSKMVKIEIMSEKTNEINDFVINEITRGTTSYDVRGGYMNQLRKKIVTVCSPRECAKIRKFISEIDPNAFITITTLSSVLGKGVGFDSLSGD